MITPLNIVLMKKVKKFLVSSLFIFSSTGFAQNEIDVLRYSKTTFGGTARNSSMAGAFGAIGGDFGALNNNPAGIGLYRKNEFTFTPTFFSQTTNTTYANEQTSDSKLNFNVNNIGLVINYNQPETTEQKGWIAANFAFGYNRTNNFHNRITIQGNNSTSSLLDVFVKNSTGRPDSTLNLFAEELAFRTYLIDTAQGPLSYFSAIPAGTTLQQQKYIETRGAMGETFMSFGGNYNNKLYVGATIGFPNINYIEESTYQETDIKNTNATFHSFSYTNSLSTKAWGVNLKLGMLYRLTDWLRVGAAVHTPTVFSVSDSYSNTITANYSNSTLPAASPEGTFKYSITTPMKAMLSMAFVLSKRGILSADYEYINYADGRLHSTPNIFINQNKIIQNTYVATSNIKVGAEWRFDPFSIRGGYALYGSPYAGSINSKTARSLFTTGIGYRQNNYFVDFAYILSLSSEYYYLYNSPTISAANNNFSSSSIMATIGLRF